MRFVLGLGFVIAAGGGCAAGASPHDLPGDTGGAVGTGTGGAGRVDASGNATGGAASGGAAGRDGAQGGCWSRARTVLATHEVFNVTWPAGPATLAGAGEIHLWGKMVLSQDGNTLSGTSRLCGMRLPPIDLNPMLGAGALLLEVPDAAWDVAMPPTVHIEATQSGDEVGSTVSYAYAATVGFSETGSTPAPWPISYTGVSPISDADADGHPGLTGAAHVGAGYVLPPTSLLSAVGPGPRADLLYLVERNVATTQLVRTSCDEASGSTTSLHFDNHIVGCHVSGGGECMPLEVKFIDDNRTIYAVTKGTTTAKVIADDATCADVRAQFPVPSAL